ncbi:MAG: hypothetical protein JW941_13475 [Candidatus Coatesbacteria bacterium]|nr:hypothetical protein [Candidatus Coatesbacteria bacterium]
MNNADEAMVQRNIELSAEFSRYLFEHPEIEAALPKGAEIVFLPDFDVDLCAYNSQLGREMEARGERVVSVLVGPLREKIISRIESIAVQV